MGLSTFVATPCKKTLLSIAGAASPETAKPSLLSSVLIPR